MIEIGRKLKDSFDQVQVKQLLFDNQKFYRRHDFWILVIVGVSCSSLIFLENSLGKYFSIILFLYLITIGFGAVMFSYKLNKKKLKKKEIKVDEGLLKPWDSDEYHSMKINTFYDALFNNSLVKKEDTDINLIEEYEKLCDSESGFLKTNKSYLIGGGAVILFILPVWREIIKLLFQESDNFTETMKLISSLILIITLITYLLTSIDKALVEWSNSSSSKYVQIRRLLRVLRLNLMINKSTLTDADE